MPATISGHFLANSIDTLHSELGEDRFVFLASRCPPLSAAILQRQVQADEWVESENWYTVYDVMIRELFGGDHARLTAFARRACSRLLGPFQKRVLRLLTPPLVLHLVVRSWTPSLKGAEVRVKRLPALAGRKQIELTITDSPKQPAFVHACRGYVEEILSYSCARDATVSVVDIVSGCGLVISYS